MTQTRAATAIINSRSKQELVRLLFGHGSRMGPNSHRNLVDHSSYSYNDLRKAYLERIQVLHPDKRRNETLLQTTNAFQSTISIDSDFSSEAFVQLQTAWENYDNAYKFIRQTNGTATDSMESNFTMFGVGCSFSDTDAEKDARNEIMDQASRGWFTAGNVTSGEIDNNIDDKSTMTPKPSSPIIDQSDFISINDNVNNPCTALESDQTRSEKTKVIRRKFLVEHHKGIKS
jgi:hypothetical protein